MEIIYTCISRNYLIDAEAIYVHYRADSIDILPEFVIEYAYPPRAEPEWSIKANESIHRGAGAVLELI